ncbi:MAG: hypothetical protein ACOCV0_01780 [Alkalispirochaeta sp.]
MILLVFVPFLAGVAVIMLGGCAGKDDTVALPETPVLFGQNRFALVTDRYVRVYELPDTSSVIRMHLRRGDVLPVAGRTPDESWIELRRLEVQGWVERSSVRTFSSREQALNAGRTLEP